MIFLVGVYSGKRKAAGVVESVCGLGWQWASSFFFCVNPAGKSEVSAMWGPLVTHTSG